MTMKVLRITALLALSALLIACGKQQSSQTSANGDQQKVSQQVVDPKVERGKAVYDETGCATCHAIGGIGGRTGPSLDKIGSKYDAEKLKEILVNPQTLNPNTVMPPFEGSEEDLEALVAYLLSLK
ncbi:c-type cytochrome [Fervidibacter sacchari]|jgi:mono/diheme cytochrome c family protein|uniref:Mono/diheme cytochrome c family protein n=1 Tax=Candidatus Fervidibacter sacchari TaxID=1448929 RepID=A0ABT2EM40_9BACT|nr:c-type cytochrome [Candidatus Fervidibacter sacchari]MCS3917995.1 mono/diheme cytochrome c family protein [Candidatus Fervidibacter sacchari]WKU15811.1 c-type cytochrome [Candidatus Fervidibacter sacchari]